ncbi:MAG: acetyl-CoA synthetase [Euryarchaeota archaeon]|nr:acetyl-CoA synthetase [Euryarchaeota archaeon]
MKAEEILTAAKAEGRRVLDVHESRQVLLELGVPMNRSALAADRLSAVKAASEIGFPVVMKIVSPDVVHKTEVGGVKVGLRDAAGTGAAFDAMMASVGEKRPDARVRGVVVEEMVRGTELIVGSSCDPQFGRMLMFGMGGVFVEVYKDVSFRLVPISTFDAREMIEEIRGKAIFEGARGHPRADKESLAKVLVDISTGVARHPDIEELDINPLMVTEKGLVAVDARVILGTLGRTCPL